MSDTTATPVASARDLRDARLAAWLAQGVREGHVDASDALRVLRHELRRRNTNKKTGIARRSEAANAVVTTYAERGIPVPKNDSNDALHADHVYNIDAGTLTKYTTTEDWLAELARLREVECVTAEENYRLSEFERKGIWGEAKYEEAKISFVTIP